MALQDMSFVTIVQRMLAHTGVRMHYGHPDIFDGFWCRFHVVDVNFGILYISLFNLNYKC